MRQPEVLVIGGGPAGMAAALSARENGARDVTIVERGDSLGGILNQCIHNGFGLTLFGEELTGPEYAGRYARQVREAEIPCLLHTTVTSLSARGDVTMQSPLGVTHLTPGAVVLATGCRERPRGAISIPGDRPAGIYSAGTAQKLINCYGYLPGRRVVILGSGDIGLIMARRLTLEGAHVEAVCEIMPYSTGLTRNIVQCLEDYSIPLLLSHTVTRIFGRERVTAVEISRVDENRRPVESRVVECDTLLLSVGLIPENELIRAAGAGMDNATGGPVVDDRLETDHPGVFSCGNCLHVHDLADYASMEAVEAGRSAAAHVSGSGNERAPIACRCGFGVGSVVPQRLTAKALTKGATLYIRVKKPFGRASLAVRQGERVVAKIRSPRLTPGEMVRAVVKGGAPDGDLTIEVTENA